MSRNLGSRKLGTRAIPNLRFGLCCQFADAPIRIRTTTAASLLRLSEDQRNQKLSNLCLANAEALLAVLKFCAENDIGSFRIPSWILPVKTHPQVGYQISDLPESAKIISAFEHCGKFASERGLRTTFHPDQFVVLNSPRTEVVANSLAELE